MFVDGRNQATTHQPTPSKKVDVLEGRVDASTRPGQAGPNSEDGLSGSARVAFVFHPPVSRVRIRIHSLHITCAASSSRRRRRRRRHQLRVRKILGGGSLSLAIELSAGPSRFALRTVQT